MARNGDRGGRYYPEDDRYYDQYEDEYGQNGDAYGAYDDGQDDYVDSGDYADGGYDDYEGDGYDEETGGYDADYGGYEEPPPASRQPSMAARAAGKNYDPYASRKKSASARSRSDRSQPQRRRPSQSAYAEPPVRRRRKKSHKLRNFVIFLLLLVAVCFVSWKLFARPPAQSTNGTDTRRSGFYTVLLCATDGEELRTDTIMLAAVDTTSGQFSLLSIPRDTIVDNGYTVPKINSVYGDNGGGSAGAEALEDTVAGLLGFRPDGYMVVTYDAFKETIDAIGGVTFDVPMDMEVDNAGDVSDVITLSAGEQKLDGTQALALCRYREGYAMADIQREYVQQTFLKAAAKQCLRASNVFRFPKILSILKNYTTTNLSAGNFAFFASKLLFDRDSITQDTLPGEGLSYNGASCYGLYGQSVVDLLNEKFNPYEEALTIDDVDILTVQDGYLVKSYQTGTAFDAGSYQYG